MKRLHSLDALRGIAALTVVLWHWQHFFAIRTGALLYDKPRSLQPFYTVLMPFYEQGWAAVDLFFALSGYIFFWLYSQPIREKRIGAGKFAVLRISRLYPLFLATLLGVAALQQMYHRAMGQFFIYISNDWQHFVWSLAMAQQWLPSNVDQSFDGPAWSISIEVLLYIVFFLVVRAGLAKSWQTLSLAAAGMVLYRYNYMMGRGVMGFFMGGTIFYWADRLAARAQAKPIAWAICALAILAWTLTIGELYLSPLNDWVQSIIDDGPPRASQFLAWMGNDLYLFVFIFVVAPLTIAALALHERVLGGSNWRRLSFLGDISYSTYLLHFPLQLTLALIALHFGWAPQIFMTPYALIAFYAALIGLGALSFNIFERPMQKFLRRRASTSSA